MNGPGRFIHGVLLFLFGWVACHDQATGNALMGELIIAGLILFNLTFGLEL